MVTAGCAITPQMVPGVEVLRVDGLRHTYPNGTEALRGVTLGLSKGEFIALLGPSGAGKSTMLRCMNGLVRPTHGSILVHGRQLAYDRGSLLTARREIGFVFQQFNLVKRLSVLQNVLVGRLSSLRSWGTLVYRFPEVDKDFAMDCLDRVGMEAFANQRAEQLSGGQQQRVAIARALAQRPDVILADEPVASLDPMNAANVMELLRSLASDGIGVICNLHQVAHAREYSDRVVCLSMGEVIYEGHSDSLADRLLDSLYGTKITA